MSISESLTSMDIVSLALDVESSTAKISVKRQCVTYPIATPDIQTTASITLDLVSADLEIHAHFCISIQ